MVERHRTPKAATKTKPEKKVAGYISDVVNAMGIHGFDEKDLGWDNLMNLLRYASFRLNFAEDVCQSVALSETPAETLGKLKAWADLIRPPKTEGVDADVAAAT